MKILLISLIFMLASLSVYGAFGIATQKDNIDVPIGGQDIFQYEIQTIGAVTPQNCTFSFIQPKQGIDVKFDAQSIIVPPNSRTQVFGSAAAKENANTGSHTFTFCVSCTTIKEKDFGTNPVAQQICNIPLKVNVVEKKAAQETKKQFPTSLLVFGIAIILVLIIFVLSQFKNKNLYRHKR